MINQVKKFLPPLLGLSLLLNTHSQMYAQSLEEQTVLAALALNIVRFTTWPDEAQTRIKESIDFCVIGDNVVQESFISINNKVVGNKTLQIINLSRLRNFEDCHVLYISELKQNVLLQVFADINKHPLLTIGQGYDFAAQGGMVGLENVDGKITLHVNLPVVHESKLNISARLLKLAKIIGE
ncbi:YfiR family protein [Methylobacter sp. S3L5C]|uniref:YfiR family protein n=1 Tax=Methylobacter sp. S3L5C TaxID=2839024 RepID=UPI001FAC92E0|nr:YfiR family protein [Methylobacter sp. S3L5C]UOA10068.1 YfiR family protein [Methylobacter sp. S3L5C]